MTTPKKGRERGDDDKPLTPEEVREQKREASREAETVDDATRQQEILELRFPSTLEYPAWLYCDDGRSQVVNSEAEADELKKTGGNWQEEPYPEHPSIAPLPPPRPAHLPAQGYPGVPVGPGPGGFPRPDQGLPSGRGPRPDQSLPEGPEPRGDSSKKK